MAIIDLKLNPPENKTVLTKANLHKYFKEYGTDEDKKWYATLLKKNTITRKNNITGEEGDGYEWGKIREAVAKKYFPDISSENKKKAKAKAKKKTNKIKDDIEDWLKL